MKKIFIYIAALLLSVFVLDRAGAFLLDKLSAKVMNGETGGKINHYLSLNNTPALIIVGPSAPTYQINPANFLVNTYNIGHSNTDDCFQAGLLSILEQANKLPKNILLYINPELYNSVKADSTFHSPDANKLKGFYGKNELVTKYINQISKNEKYKYFFHLSNYNNRVINIFKNLLVTQNGNYPKNGYSPLPASAYDSITTSLDYERQKAMEAKAPPLVFNPYSTRYLTECINICKRNHVNLIVFNLPYYGDFVTPPVIKQASIYVDSLLSANQITHFNFRSQLLNLPISSPSMWKDASHLNEKGAKIESSAIAKAIEPYLVK